MEVLIHFLKSWDIDAEVKTTSEVLPQKKTNFTLATGLWKDSSIDADEVRKQAWNRKS